MLLMWIILKTVWLAVSVKFGRDQQFTDGGNKLTNHIKFSKQKQSWSFGYLKLKKWSYRWSVSVTNRGHLHSAHYLKWSDPVFTGNGRSAPNPVWAAISQRLQFFSDSCFDGISKYHDRSNRGKTEAPFWKIWSRSTMSRSSVQILRNKTQTQFPCITPSTLVSTGVRPEGL